MSEAAQSRLLSKRLVSRAAVSASVVVVSYRPGDWLLSCLKSVVGQADEVVLVDNGSEGLRRGAARLSKWGPGCCGFRPTPALPPRSTSA